MKIENSTSRQEHYREALTSAILFRVADQIEDIIATLPVDVSEEVREAIRADLSPHSKFVLSSWSLEKMQDDAAVEGHCAKMVGSAQYLVRRITEERSRS